MIYGIGIVIPSSKELLPHYVQSNLLDFFFPILVQRPSGHILEKLVSRVVFIVLFPWHTIFILWL